MQKKMINALFSAGTLLIGGYSIASEVKFADPSPDGIGYEWTVTMSSPSNRYGRQYRQAL